MTTVHQIKRAEVLPTPLLLMECRLRDGRVERWSTHAVTVEGEEYEARVLRHNQFDLRLGADEGIDASARFSVTLANVDSRYSQIEAATGWKGASLRVRFVFYDLSNSTAVTEPVAVFLGSANPPEEITEKTMRLSFVNRLSLQRVTLPPVRVQARCPWMFPATAEQREEAVNGGENGIYSRFYACGYSPDQEGGCGNADPLGVAYTSCNYTKNDCAARGMFDEDSQGRPTARFGGFQFLPASVLVRTHGAKSSHVSDPLDNRARANDVVPMVYGTAWVQPPVVFTRNDGNLTHCEVLLGVGQMEGVHKVVVNGVEIPLGVTGRDMTATGWYNVVSLGTRNGGFNLNFRDQAGNALGDPHGSAGILAVALPNRLNDGRSVPRVEVLLDGLRLERFDVNGESLGVEFTRNPAWILLDLLRRSGWRMEEIDVRSFAQTAARCDEPIEAKDANGNPLFTPRFECNLTVTQRRSAAELVRGVRMTAALLLTFDGDGRLQLRPEAAMADQHPVKPETSNGTEPWHGGWPTYEFGDGSNGLSGLLRRPSGEPALRRWSRGTSECPNRLSAEFQNAFNEYRQDSVSLVDLDDVLTTGQELSAALPAMGLPHFDQAARIVRFHLMKGLYGNEYVEFETSVQALGLRPGDLITVTYLKDGLDRAPYRIVKLTPAENYETVRITGQRHVEGWHALLDGAESMDAGQLRRYSRQGGTPRPLAGVRLNSDGEQEFDVEERPLEQMDGSAAVQLRVRFSPPSRPAAAGAGVPLLALSPLVQTSGGTLSGGQTWYYAISAVDANGEESDLSFVVRATLPEATSTNRVVLTGISLAGGTAAVRVYRGASPLQLLRIAETAGPVGQFIDDGLEPALEPPPDANYDHANFHWRMELLPETQAVLHGEALIGNASLAMLEHEYRGATVRIVRGRGQGQERLVMDNDSSTLFLATPWTTAPDATSWFAVSEPSWRFAGSTRSDEIVFEVLNRDGTYVQISGRSANALDQETSSELSVLHRHLIGGAEGGMEGEDFPPTPFFALAAGRRGRLELLGIGFETLENTRGITAGTLTLHYWNELDGVTGARLAEGVDSESGWLILEGAEPMSPGDLLQIGAELMKVVTAGEGNTVEVERAVAGGPAGAHPALSAVWRLRRHVVVVPFPRRFFGTPASGSYLLTIPFPHARIAAAELFATNTRGAGPASVNSYAGLLHGGLRTLAGGQYTIQVPGEPALESMATPPLVIDEKQAVGDIFATLTEAPAGGDLAMRLRVNGDAYCELTVLAGQRVSNTVNGVNLAPLPAGAEMTLDIIGVPLSQGSRPGRNLTVTIRV